VTGWNAITLTNTFNTRLEPTQFQAVSPVPLTLLNLSYSYDQGSGKNNGSVVQITNGRDTTRTTAYTYDQLNRLATAQTPSAATWGDSYVYDAWGNLLQKNVIKGTAESMALTVNNKNQVTTPAFTYDAAGNVTWDTTNALNYDAEGRMNPTTGTTYTYDGDGRRVQKSDGTLYWVDDALRPLSVGTTSGSITRDYIFLGGKRIAFVPLSSGNPYYYLSDHLGSTAVIASGDGKTIQWEADYFPFGAQRTVITNLADNPYQFTGYEYDSSTGYNYALARFDAGRWGRFLSPDPYLGSMDITNPQSLNRYAYVLNNPLNLIDPLGLDCIVDGELDGSIDNSLECDSAGGVWDDSTSDGQAVGTDVDGGPPPQIDLSGNWISNSGSNQFTMNQVPPNPCNYAGRNPDPSAWAALGHDTKNNPFTTTYDVLKGFPIGGYLDAQPLATGTVYQKAAYGNYVFGAYMAAAGFPLSVTLSGADAIAAHHRSSNPNQYRGRDMDPNYKSLPQANVMNITAGYNAQQNGTLCHK
jgi:RHS repeat-associated protein